MTRLDLIAAAGLPFLVLGCRILPDDGPPAPTVAVPDSWSTRANEPISEDGTPWWDDFGDRELSGVIEEALEQNVDLRTSVARLAAALAQARIAGADRLPTVNAGSSFNRSKQIFVGLPVPGGDVLDSTFTTYGASLDLSWEADLWGRIKALTDAAQGDVLVAAEDLRAARQSIAAQSAKTLNGEAIETCAASGDWVASVNCAVNDQECDDSGASPVCVDVVTPLACGELDDLRCASDGVTVEKCAASGDWVFNVNCANNGKVCIDGKVTAYVCENRICQLPTTDPAVFAEQIATVKAWPEVPVDAPGEEAAEEATEEPKPPKESGEGGKG